MLGLVTSSFGRLDNYAMSRLRRSSDLSQRLSYLFLYIVYKLFTALIYIADNMEDLKKLHTV